MSFRAMSWAASVKTHTPVQKLILLLLADRANDQGFCFPSMQTIADDACVSRQCVIENVKKLASQGLINVTRRTIKDEESGTNRQTSNLYHLNTGVVNMVDRVVNMVDGGSQRGLQGVVNEVDTNLSIEPINEPITSSAIASAEELFNQSKKDPVRTGKDVARRDEFSYTEDFTAFWTAYPRHVGKGKAFAEWKRIKGRPPVEELIQAVKKQQRSEDWTKERGKYIPHPSTWLHQRRWEDEVDVRKSERPYGYE